MGGELGEANEGAEEADGDDGVFKNIENGMVYPLESEAN